MSGVAELCDLAARAAETAKRAGADAAEAQCREGSELTVKVRLGQPELVKEAGLRALGLRVLVGNRAALTYTSDLRPAAIEALVARTVALAGLAEPDEFNALPCAERATELPPLELWDPNAEVLDATWALAQARTAERAALDADPRITNSNGSRVSRMTAGIAFANTDSFVGGYRGTWVSLMVEPVCEDAGGKKRVGEGWTAGRFVGDLTHPEAVGLEAARNALSKLGSRKVDTQSVPVVFHPEAGRSLLRGLFAAANGSSFYRKASYLLGREGEACASPLVTLVDDPLRPRAPGSRPFDGDGLPSRLNVMVDAGVLKTILCDTYSARRLGRRSTGSAGRGIGASPRPTYTNLIMQPGRTSADALVSTMGRGLYVTDLLGSGFNATTGDFSRGATGFWVEGGERAFPVSEVTLSSNYNQLWPRVDAVGDDFQLRTSVGCPTFRVAEMTLAGRG